MDEWTMLLFFFSSEVEETGGDVMDETQASKSSSV
jgi:hypothetical protein